MSVGAVKVVAASPPASLPASRVVSPPLASCTFEASTPPASPDGANPCPALAHAATQATTTPAIAARTSGSGMGGERPLAASLGRGRRAQIDPLPLAVLLRPAEDEGQDGEHENEAEEA